MITFTVTVEEPRPDTLLFDLQPSKTEPVTELERYNGHLINCAIAFFLQSLSRGQGPTEEIIGDDPNAAAEFMEAFKARARKGKE